MNTVEVIIALKMGACLLIIVFCVFLIYFCGRMKKRGFEGKCGINQQLFMGLNELRSPEEKSDTLIAYFGHILQEINNRLKSGLNLTN